MLNSKKKFDLAPRLKFGVGRGYSQNKLLQLGAVFCLVIAVALTFNTIRLLFGRHSAENKQPSSAPQVLGASDTKSEDPLSVQFVDYQVQKGDTLFNISQKFQVEWTTLASLNNIKSPYALKPNQVIKIPK